MGKIYAYYTMPHPPIILPEIGKGEEKKIQKSIDACRSIADEINSIKPDTVIIITPHGPLFRDAVSVSFDEHITGSMDAFDAPDVQFDLSIDITLSAQILKLAEENNIPTVQINKSTASVYDIDYELDHGTMIPLYFINQKYRAYKLVHITYGLLPKLQLYKFGMCIQKAVGESHVKAVIIASGDLSHRLSKDGPYEYSKYGKVFDDKIISLLESGDVRGIFNINSELIKNAGECGMMSYYILLGAMNGISFKGDLLSYESTFGVGYSTMKLIPESNLEADDIFKELVEEEEHRFKQKTKDEDAYIRLARESLAYYILHGNFINIPSYVPDHIKNIKRGAFVSIKKNGELRGCIGTIFPTKKNLAFEIIHNAVEAGMHDPRFTPVDDYELNDLDFSVDVLTKPEKADKAELDPKRYGVIVRSGYKTGLLLPDLEGVETVDKQIAIALQKAGIAPHEEYTIEKFEVERHTLKN